MSHTETYRVKGMHCASCSSIIEKTFKKVDGVLAAEVNYGTEKAKLSFDEAKTNPQQLSKKIERLGYSLVIPTHADHAQASPSSSGQAGPTAAEMGMSPSEHAAHLGLGQSKQDKLAEIAALKTHVLVGLPLAGFSILVMGLDLLIQLGSIAPLSEAVMEFVHHLLPIFATYALFVIGRPYLLGVVRFLRYGKANMDTLIGIGTLVAFLYSFIVTALEGPLRPYLNVEYTYYDVTIVVIVFITLGKYLEARSKLKTGDAIEKLLNLQAKTALVMRDGHEVELPIGEVAHGDLLVIKPGARIPVDGVITQGTSFVDEALVTGEPMPVKKSTGDPVVAGTINTTGAFTFQATKVGAETLLAHIINMVEEAQGSRAPIQALADKISGVFVPIVLAIAGATLTAWLAIGSANLGFSQALTLGLTAFVGILVIACPCALGLATPTAIIVGVGKGAREGILIKDAATLEKLHQVNTVVVDKTGTITRGKPEVTGVQTNSALNEQQLISILAALERKSEHPIAHAVIEYAKAKKLKLAEVTQFDTIKGRGLKGTIEGTEYFAGNSSLMTELGLTVDAKRIETETLQGKTPVILATSREVLGIVLVADTVKPEATAAIKQLHAMGIATVMLTGDHRNTAQAIAREVGIDEVVPEVMPEGKLRKIKELQQAGRIVAMAGDGVNDAPALAQADVGIAMATGTDVAIETAGITLLHGDISKLVKAIRLSKLTMRGIKQNLFWAFIYNIVGIPLAAGVFYPLFGWLLSPVFAGLAMAFSSVSVVANSLRLKAKSL